MTWRILITDPIDPAGIDLLAEEAEIVTTANFQHIERYDALIVRSATQVTRDLMTSGKPRLQVVGRAGVGVDNIDLDAARELGIVVVNSPLAASQAVAEHALALMFALARRIPAGDRSMKAGQWEKGELKGVELAGRTLGIIGVGRIGSLLADMAGSLGMRVLGYDLLLDDDQVQAAGAEPVALESLLSGSNFISLHVPLTDETRSMIDRQAMAKMPAGSYLICTARGGVIDEEDLLQALESGQLAGAGLDVFRDEPPGASELVRHPNVVATPHIAANTHEAQRRASVDIAAEVLAALSKRQLRWRVA